MERREGPETAGIETGEQAEAGPQTLVSEHGVAMNDQSEEGSPKAVAPLVKLRPPADHLQGDESWEIEEPPFNYVSRWEDPDAFSRRKGWGPEQANRSYQEPGEKYFTAQAFSYLPLFEKTSEEIEILIRKHRVDDLTRRLVLQDFEQQTDPDLRSPSPEPIYDQKTGQRTNTREQRLKEKYMKERYRLITELLQMCEGYVAPSDYKPPKKHVKIFIPESAEINYIGQIIGPGG